MAAVLVCHQRVGRLHRGAHHQREIFQRRRGEPPVCVFVRRDTRPDDVPELELPTFDPNSGQKRTFPTEEEGFYPVLVETGLADPQNAEILSGIEVGDEVFVNYVVTDADW